MKYRKYKVKNKQTHKICTNFRFIKFRRKILRSKLHQVHNICLIYKIKYITITFNSIYIIKHTKY